MAAGGRCIRLEMNMESNDGLHHASGLKHSTPEGRQRLQSGVSEHPNSSILKWPSKRGLSERIGRSIANGEQPADVCHEPLIRQGCGPVGFLERFPHLQHPAAAPPPMPASGIKAIYGMVETTSRTYTIGARRECNRYGKQRSDCSPSEGNGASVYIQMSRR